MAKYFIIIGYAEIWKKIKAAFFGNQSREGISKGIGKDNEYTLFFIQAGNELILGSIKKMFQTKKIGENDEIIIFAHKYGGPRHPGVKKETLKELKNNSSNLEYLLFSTANKKAYPVQLLEKLNENTDIISENLPTWEELKKEVKKKDMLELLHRIAYLFLPLDIDLMGICEVLKENRETDAENYFKEAFMVKENDREILKSPAYIIDEKLKKIENGDVFKDLNFDDKIKNDIKECIKKPADGLEIEKIKEQLKSSDFKDFQKTFGQYDPEQNPFHQWFCGVMEEFEKFKANYTAN